MFLVHWGWTLVGTQMMYSSSLFQGFVPRFCLKKAHETIKCWKINFHGAYFFYNRCIHLLTWQKKKNRLKKKKWKRWILSGVFIRHPCQCEGAERWERVKTRTIIEVRVRSKLQSISGRKSSFFPFWVLHSIRDWTSQPTEQSARRSSAFIDNETKSTIFFFPTLTSFPLLFALVVAF